MSNVDAIPSGGQDAATNGDRKDNIFKRIKNAFTPTKQAPEEWSSFEAGTFLNLNYTAVPLDRLGRPKDRDKPAETREKVNKPVYEAYSQFLSSHLTKLIDLYNTDLNAYTRIMNSTEHAYERKLVERLTKEITSESAAKKIELVDKPELTKFLETSAGLEVTTMLLEQQASYQMFAAGLSMALDPAGNRDLDLRDRAGRRLRGVVGIQPTTLGMDQGAFSSFLDKYVDPLLGEDINTAGRRRRGLHIPRSVPIIGILTGMVAGGPAAAEVAQRLCLSTTETAIAGVLGIAAVPVMVGLRELMKAGVTYDTRYTATALKSIQNSPNAANEQDYLRRLYGIDTADFQVAGDRVKVVPGRHPETTSQMERNRVDALGKIFTRIMFYESIGVPPDALDTLPEQFIFREEANSNSEQLGTKMQQELVKALDMNGVGPGSWDTLTGEQKLIKVRETRAQMIVDRLKVELDEKAELKKHQKVVSNLDGQLGERDGATPVKGRLKVYTERKAKLDEQKTKLTERQGKTSSAESKEKESVRRKAEAEVVKLEKKLQAIYIAAGENPPALAANPTVAEAQAYLDNIDNAIGQIGDIDAAGAVTGGSGLNLKLQQLTENRGARVKALAAELIQPIIDQYQTQIDTLDDSLKKSTDNKHKENLSKRISELVSSAEQQIREARKQAAIDADLEIQRKTQEINKNIQELEGARATLETLKNEYAEAKQEEDKAKEQELKQIPHELTQNRMAFDSLLNGHALQVTPAQLRDWPTQQIYDYVIATRAAYGGVGGIPVPTRDEDIQKLRERVIRAKTEALTNYENQWEPSSSTQQIAYLFVTRRITHDDGGNIVNNPGRVLNAAGVDTTLSENDLLRMADNQLLFTVKANYVLPPMVTDAQLIAIIQDARNEAIKRLRIAERVYTEEALYDNSTQVESLDKAIATEQTKADKGFESEKQFLQSVKTMVKRQGEIFTASETIALNKADYSDITAITNQQPGFTDSERKSHYPLGYFAWLQVLFGYQDNVTEREAKFNELKKLYPPNDLAKLISEPIANFAFLPGAPGNLNTVLSSIAARPSLEPMDIRQGLRDIINATVKEAESKG